MRKVLSTAVLLFSIVLNTLYAQESCRLQSISGSLLFLPEGGTEYLDMEFVTTPCFPENLTWSNVPEWATVEPFGDDRIRVICDENSQGPRSETLYFSYNGEAAISVMISQIVPLIPPDTPPAPVKVSDPCGGPVILGKNGLPGPGITWYWQGTDPTGQLTSAPASDPNYTVPQNGRYYLRAYRSANNMWSNVSSYIDVSINSGDIWYKDGDGDGRSASKTTSCGSPGEGYVLAVDGEGDCDDDNPFVYMSQTWYLDADNDGHAIDQTTSCGSPGSGWKPGPLPVDDCDDGNPGEYAFRTWYLDADNDGHAIDQTTSCGSPGSGWKAGPLPVDDCDGDSITDPANDCVAPVSSDPSDHNYIYTRTYQRSAAEMGMATDAVIPHFTESDYLIQQITYYDGLGRPMQQNAIRQSPDGRDIVTHMGYDDYGRMDKEWLPVTDGQQSTDFGHFVTGDMEASTRGYYDTPDTYGADFPNVSGSDVNPYSQKHFEPSPLNRVLKQAAPGEAWKLNTSGEDHSIEFAYLVNTHDPLDPGHADNDNVRLFQVNTVFADNTYTPTLVYGDYGEGNPVGYYAQGELYMNITKDENHASTGPATDKLHTTEEFTDKQGRVVLKRTYALVDPGDGSPSVVEAHDTYYVYDDFDNLTYVLPPKMEATTTDLADLNDRMDQLGYQYVYDHRNRLVEKKIPGKGWEYIVYNKLDLPIMTQDAVQRENGEWLFTKYDAFGRVAITGKMADDDDRKALQGRVDQSTNRNWVVQKDTDASVGTGGAVLYYDHQAFPTTNITEVLTINYYDAYREWFLPTGAPTSVDLLGRPGETSTSNVQGLPTVSRVRVLDQSPAQWINTVTRYDAKGRAIYTYSENEYLGTVDIVETQLDFVGRPEKIRTLHQRNGNTIVTLDNFTYDHVGRLLAQTQCIGDASLGDECPMDGDTPADVVWNGASQGNIGSDLEATGSITVTNATILPGPDGETTLRIVGGSGQELIVHNDYDELGQLVQKKVGGAPGMDYAGTNGLQTVDYAYNVRGWLKQINDPNSLGTDLFAFGVNYNTVLHGGTSLYNGNIAETEWRTANTDNSLRWYRHGYDPLNRLVSSIDNTADQRYSLTNLSYDKNGNVLGLTRKGHLNTGSTSFGNMDVLGYVYDSGNKVLRINDSGNDSYGFKDGTNTNDDFGYDPNGNLEIDRNKGINSITYNHLNMPTLVDFGATGNIAMVYAADGTKLKKTASNGTVTEYANGYVYEGGQLQFFNQPEGYVMPDGNGYRYVYQFKDHVDNVRLSYTDNNGTLEIVEENNFYPFGGKMKGYNTSVSPLGNSTAQRWKFGGMELDESLNNAMGTYDFGARTYDPWGIRWWNIDPKADLMRRHSPYNYAFNNPVFFLDPDGMMPCPTGDCPEGPLTEQESIQVSGSAEPMVFTETATKTSVEGFHVEGKIEGKFGKAEGSLSGFGASKEFEKTENSVRGGAEVHGLEAEVELRGGTEDNNIAVEAEGSAFKANADFKAGLHTGDEGKFGIELGANAKASALNGSVTPSVSLFGVKLGVTIGGSVGSAHIGADVTGIVDTKNKEFEATGQFNIGLGAGLKVGFTLSNTKQKIHKRK